MNKFTHITKLTLNFEAELRGTNPGEIRNNCMSEIMDKIIEKNTNSDCFTSIITEGLMLELIGLLGREIAISKLDRPKWLKIILEYLNDDYSNKYRLEDLSQIANIYPSYLVNAFKVYTNKTIGEYLRNIRIQKACKKLGSNIPIAQIAYDCGFADQSHLNRSFKKVLGVTPLTYRNKILFN